MFQMAPTMPKGYQYMVHTLANGTWALRYGGEEMYRLRKDYGDNVVMIPSMCITLAPEWQQLLYGEDLWTSSSWPFLMMSTHTRAAVIPFEELEDGTMEPVLAIIPRGFDAQAYLPNWGNLVNVMRLAGADITYRFYEKLYTCEI